jgi:hypothetical protein
VVDLPQSAFDAKRVGSRYYFSGIPCKNGHLSKRLTRNHTCCTCESLQSANRRGLLRERDPEKFRKIERTKYEKKRAAADPEKWREKARQYYRRNAESRKEVRRKYYLENREKILAYHREYRKRRGPKHIEYQRQYQKSYTQKIRDLIAVLRSEMPDLLKEFGL